MGNIVRDRLRTWYHHLRHLWSPTWGRLLFHLAEWESITLHPGAPAPWRKRHLDFRGVFHGTPFYIGRGFWLQYGRSFSFGERCSFGEFARIMNHAPISIGDDFIAATGLQLNSGDHDPVTMSPNSRPIRIGNRVWCGANVTILSGVTIADDVVIGAGSVVRNDIGSGTVVAGVPAKIIRQISRDPRKTWRWSV